MQHETSLSKYSVPALSAPVKILALSGSTRSRSWNSKLLKILEDLTRGAGASVTTISLRDFPLPLYDGDLEEESGIPKPAQALRRLLIEHQGFLIASPEYNGSVTAVLKNALDWCSRPQNGQDGLLPFRGKPVAIVAASISPYGGVRSLAHLRLILGKMGAAVLGDEMAIAGAAQAFTETGGLANPAAQSLAETVTKNLVRAVAQISGAAAA